MEKYDLSPSDQRLLAVIWEFEPLASGRLVELCRERLGWKKSTTYTMLKRLCAKGLAQNLDACVTALVPRERVRAAASAQLVEESFAGSLPQFLVSFLGQRPISGQEAAELKRLIDSYQGQEGSL